MQVVVQDTTGNDDENSGNDLVWNTNSNTFSKRRYLFDNGQKATI